MNDKENDVPVLAVSPGSCKESGEPCRVLYLQVEVSSLWLVISKNVHEGCDGYFGPVLPRENALI